MWEWFKHLSRSRGGGFGVVPVNYQEIEAYARLMGVQLTPIETLLIRDLDDVAIAVAHRTSKSVGQRDDGIRNLTSAKDADGLKKLMGSFAARKKK